MKRFLSNLKGLRPKNFFFLTIAGMINAIGITIFLIPLNLYDSGISGTSYLLNNLTPSWLTLSVFLIVLNVPFYILASKKIGIPFVLYSTYAIVIYAFVAFLIQTVLPIDFGNASPIVGEDKLLACIFGGLFSGIGSGMVIRYGGAIDGMEVLAVMFHKKIGITVGPFMMIYNVILYSTSAIIYSSWTLPLYSIIAYAVGTKTIDFVVDGLDKGKAAFIITNNEEELAKQLSEKLNRGVTIIDGHGYYSNSLKKIIYVVVNRFEIAKIKEIVSRVDESAFVSISEVTDTMGSSIKFLKK